MGPRHFLHIPAEGNVLVEAAGLHCIDFSNVAAARTAAGLYEGVVIDVLVCEFAETVSARLVVYKSLEIVRRRVGTHRNHCDSGAVTPHIGKAAVVGTVLYHHNQSPAYIVVYRRYAGSRKGGGKVRRYSGIEGVLAAETGLANGVHRSHTTVGGHTEDSIDIEVILVSEVRFYVEEVAVGILYGLEILSFADVLGIEAVGKQNYVHAFACSGFLQGNEVTVTVFVVILLYGHCTAVILAIQQEDYFAAPVARTFAQFGSAYGKFAFTCSGKSGDFNPVRLTLDRPVLPCRGTENKVLAVRCIKSPEEITADRELPVCSETLELTPIGGSPILSY